MNWKFTFMIHTHSTHVFMTIYIKNKSKWGKIFHTVKMKTEKSLEDEEEQVIFPEIFIDYHYIIWKAWPVYKFHNGRKKKKTKKLLMVSFLVGDDDDDSMSLALRGPFSRAGGPYVLCPVHENIIKVSG